MPVKRKYYEQNCRTCGQVYTTYKSARMSYCSKECKINKPTSPSIETRKKVSNSRKKWLAENPDKHPWKRNSKFTSVPCENLKKILNRENIIFVEEYNPLKDRAFAIDIAFPDIKLGIEVNGNQHYTNDGTLKKYYQERHDLIVSNGWTLIELHYTDCFIPDRIMKILKNRRQPDYSDIFKERERKRLEKQRKKSKKKQKIDHKALKEERKKKILESNIDFSKLGWGKEVSKLLGFLSNKGGGWVKNNMPNFYEKNCFKGTKKRQEDKSKYANLKPSNKPSPTELHKMVWNESTVKVAQKFSCSDKAVEKWCKKYNIPKPPRGFWTKIQNSKFEGQFCPLPNLLTTVSTTPSAKKS